MTSPGIDKCSLVPLFVEAYVFEQRLGVATAFPWLCSDGSLMLVTNWHVVSGRHNETNRPEHDLAGLPDRLRVHVPYQDRALRPFVLDVPTIDADGEPLWFEHPVHGRAVDVAALEFSMKLPEDVGLMPMNAIKFVPLKQRIGMPLFILGFPFERIGIGLPIWKQASLASEPYMLNFSNNLFLIVDTASRPGMSGSPVIQRVHGQVQIEEGSGAVRNGDGACNFIGIYSGRFYTKDKSDAQLGRVWPTSLILELIRAAQAMRRLQKC